jgi:hypothetical protein
MTIAHRFAVLTACSLVAACSVQSTASSPSPLAEGKTGRTASALSVAPKNTFARAVCVCGDLSLAGSLKTEAAPGQSADVGVTGKITMSTDTKIDGALIAGGPLGFSGEVGIAKDLLTPKDISGTGDLAVGASLSCGGSITTAGTMNVKGALAVAGAVTHSGERAIGSTQPFAASALAQPCGCDAFDVAAAVALAKTSNDDAARSIDERLAAVGENELTLESGRYYLEDPAAVGRTHFTINGAVSIYVAGSLALVGESNFALADGATLDLYVSGGVGYAGSVVAGNAKDPSAFRLYVGGKDAIVAGAGEATYHGFIFAPDAEVQFAGTTEVEGALFTKGLTYAGSLEVKYAAPAERADAPACADMPEPYETPIK